VLCRFTSTSVQILTPAANRTCSASALPPGVPRAGVSICTFVLVKQVIRQRIEGTTRSSSRCQYLYFCTSKALVVLCTRVQIMTATGAASSRYEFNYCVSSTKVQILTQLLEQPASVTSYTSSLRPGRVCDSHDTGQS
jgi:hypothetical protein